MGVTTFTEEHCSPIAPHRLFKAMITESRLIIPKLNPDIKSMEIEGTSGVAGSIAKTVFNEGSNIKYLRHRLDSVDHNNFTCKYTLLDGNLVHDQLESLSCLKKFEPAPNGGCIIKITFEYHIKGDVTVKEEDIKAHKPNSGEIYKAIEDHLIKNPTICA